MAQPKLNKTNIVDLAVVFVIILIITITGIYFLQRPVVDDNKLRVTIEITDQDQVATILPVVKNSEEVYFNSVNLPVDFVSLNQLGNNLEIMIEGPGHIDQGGDTFFNGQRILIGQKSEIHASYFAQGKIIKVENAN